ncbi:hypothetical protein EGW08_020495 [Elysia chlorotica]|uniref:Alpha/beta hydrolase fold-5 domain-containing protein n=1 Tax=Elysia chlorotica TaxID=188477 RepID=A0A433SR71_ELYCH|nr:hypothetical protein EGW08_020495 [Elysia chlorotica]
MSGIRTLVWVALSVLCVQTGSALVTTRILRPIRETGDEVGLIFFPESDVKGEDYNKTARAIQEASKLRVWVALTDNYLFDVVTGPDVYDAMIKAVKKLVGAGMESDSFVGVAHGWSGYLLQTYAQNSGLKAIILMGSTVARNTQLRDFPIPVLTLAAELDGVTRMTRIVEEYDKLTKGMPASFRGLYRTPVIYIEGANHAQFASGSDQSLIDKSRDLEPEITDDEAHRWIGKYVNDFLTVTFSSEEDDVDNSLTALVEPFMDAVNKFQPFLDMRNFDTNGVKSMWTVVAQKMFAGEYSDEVAVSNEVVGNPWFYVKSPSVDLNDFKVVLDTKTLVDVATKSDSWKFQSQMESPVEIDMKLVSKNAIWEKLAAHNDSSLRTEPNSCEALNQFALTLAIAMSTEKAQERYLARGWPIILEEDAMRWSNALWTPSRLRMWEDIDGLHVRSVAMETDDAHYCKVLSVYRAMEWVNIDSVRVNPFA